MKTKNSESNFLSFILSLVTAPCLFKSRHAVRENSSSIGNSSLNTYDHNKSLTDWRFHINIACKMQTINLFSVNTELQTQCLTHMLWRMQIISWNLSAGTSLHKHLLSVHTHTQKKKKSSDAQDTCVIDKVGIRVDVFGKRESREKSVNSSPCHLFPQFSFYNNNWRISKTGQVIICLSESCVRRTFPQSGKKKNQESWLDCPVHMLEHLCGGSGQTQTEESHIWGLKVPH